MKIQETIYEMRHQPVITTVSIIGTALAIFLIMTVVMMNQVMVAPFAPESNRDRWLVNRYLSLKAVNEEGDNNAAMSYHTADEIYHRLPTAETVTIFGSNYMTLCSAPGGTPINVEAKTVDDQFWKVMDFTYIDGVPFDKAQFDGGEPLVVIDKSVAQRLYNTPEAAGKDIRINYVDYKVCGVVEDVSPIADMAFSEIWIPISSTNQLNYSWRDGIMGAFHAIILAKTPSDFPQIRREFEESHRKFFNEFDGKYEYIQRERPYDQEVSAHTIGANLGPDMKRVRNFNYIIYAILLIVPAINLSSMTHSRLRRQEEIIGVKRAFGATRANILIDLLIENFLITLIAGCVGLLLSVIFAYFASNALFTQGFIDHNVDTQFSAIMIMQWNTFGYALAFCFILNLVSTGLPSILAARTNIVNALSKR